MSHLSGGNQQKVVLGKVACTRPKLLLVDEPTHGVDVGAREEIYRVIDDLARQGAGVIVVSSYLPEVLRISDRILVMREGRIVLETPRTDATEELLLHAATRGEHELRPFRRNPPSQRGRLTPDGVPRPIWLLRGAVDPGRRLHRAVAAIF